MSDHVSSRICSATTTGSHAIFDSNAAAEGILDDCADNDEGSYISDLRIFLEILGLEGRQNLYNDIVDCMEQLRELRDSIVTSLIAPSKCKSIGTSHCLESHQQF